MDFRCLLITIFIYLIVPFVTGLGAQTFPVTDEGLRVLKLKKFFRPISDDQRLPLIVMLVDSSTDETILLSAREEHLRTGNAVLEVTAVDLTGERIAELVSDVLELRRRVKQRSDDTELDADRMYFLPATFAIEQDVPFYFARGYHYGMDVRYPRSISSEGPTVLQIAHKTGCRRCHYSYAGYDDGILDALTLLGYPTVYADHYGAGFIDYDKVDWMPQSIHPAKAAVTFLKDRADRFGIDSSRLVALGFSKGGTAAAMLAVTANEPALEPGGKTEGPSSRVAGGIAIGPYLDLPTLYEDAGGAIDERWDNPLAQWGHPDRNPDPWRAGSVTTYVDEGAAPMLLIAGGEDSYRPKQQERLARLLRATGVAHRTVVVPGLGHRVPVDEKTLTAILAFIASL